MKPCFKREVCAVLITEKGEISVGQNIIYNKEVMDCPRAKGEGYYKCTSVCQQKGHAETEAIRKAIEARHNIENANLYLMGHYRICGPCKAACDEHNINVIITNEEGK